MINKISFKNYKLFKEKQTLELKPITILIGKNNTGKSAIMKLPVLIGASMSGLPINNSYRIGEDRDNSVELGSDFKDLVYNRNETGFIEFEIFDKNNTLEIALNKDDGILEYKLNGQSVETSSNFEGLLVNGNPIKGLDLNIDYLGAIRIEPESSYNFSSDNYQKIGIKGQNAYPILIADYKNANELISKVSSWYKKNFENWELSVIENKLKTETTFGIAISNSNLNPINIKQTGQGIHQVLPLVVRSYMKEDEPILIVIEEPETHLHPAAHGNLAELFVDSYLEDKNKRYLIETHSQNFVLRLRALVAEKKIETNDLAIYYIDFNEEENISSLRKIEIDQHGNLLNDDWPQGIFEEASTEVWKIINAQNNVE